MSDDLTLQQLVAELAVGSGPDLRGYKLSTLERRLRKRMSEVGVLTFRDYLSLARGNAAETVSLLNTVLINVTEFFRDPQAWQCLREEGLPLALRELQPGDPLRVWSLGCASGEEPYSLAILLSEYLGTSLADYNIKIYATDIDEEALTIARRGEYPLERLHRVPGAATRKVLHRAGLDSARQPGYPAIDHLWPQQHAERCAHFALQSCGLPECLNIF